MNYRQGLRAISSLIMGNMRTLLGAKLHVVICILVVAILSVVIVDAFPMLRIVENLTYDLRIKYFSKFREQSPDIVIVGITEETLSLLPYRSPIDRHFLSELMLEIEKKGARTIGLDILLDQATEPEKDAELKKTMASMKIPLVVATADTRDGLLQSQVEYQGSFLEGLEQGSAAVIQDSVDGVVRAVPMGGFAGESTRSFVAQLAITTGINISKEDGLLVGFQHGPDRNTPLFPVYPAHTVSLLPGEWIAGKIVLVGFELEFEDRHLTPLTRGQPAATALPGVQIHAQALAQLLEGREILKTETISNLVISVLFASLGLSLLRLQIKLRLQLIVAVALITIIWVGGVMIFVSTNTMINLLSPSLALCLSSLISFLFQWQSEQSKRKFIHLAFSRYLSVDYVDQLVANPDQLSVNGEHRVITFLFTDLAGFTPLTESIPAEDLITLINEYLDKTCEIAIRHGGMVAAIVGDALHVMFNAPVLQEDHAQRAIEAALELDEFCQKFAAAKQSEGIQLGLTRIGINTGVAVVGNFGGKERLEYTAMGDAINTAARLESVNKHLDTRICVSESSVSQCNGINFRPVGNLVLKGKSDSVKVYEPLNDNSSQTADRNKYLNSYNLMEELDPEALGAFRALSESNPDDSLVSYHLARLEKGESGTTIVMKEK